MLSRVADRSTAPEPPIAAPSTAADTADERAEAAPADEPRRRRRGRRGRGGRGGARSTGPSTATSATPEKHAAPDAEGGASGGAGSRARGRGDGNAERRRGRGPIRGLGDRGRGRARRLEEPLPEDVAFRPAAEGGDDSLLARRRPPRGLRTTNRVILVGGRRYLPAVGASRTQGETDGRDSPEEPGAAREEPGDTRTAQPELTEAGVGDRPGAEPSRRRRGRRGGRRHRRSRPEAAGSEGDGAAAPSADGSVAAPSADELVAAPSADESAAAPSADGSAVAPSADGSDAAPSADGSDAAPSADGSAAAPPPAPPSGELSGAFSALGVAERSLGVLAGMGFTEPTPIQERALPALLAGRDVVGVAQTGSGKTLAFALPLVEHADPGRREVQAVVLVPTRELAQQVLGVLEEVAAPYGLSVVGLLGGRALAGDFRALEGRPQVIVGTPGRVLDHLRRGTLELRRVRYAVLDEADEMLDIGFLPDITRILQRTPRRRQTALFSATMPHAVMRLVRRYMEDPATVSVAEQHDTVDTVDQYYVEVAHRDKLRGLRELVERELKGRTLVFSRTRRGVDYVSARLREMGVSAGALHGDMDQRRRDQVVRRFRQGELDLLVATNVAARGLDIPEITHVVNFDVPQNAEEYVHRVGRTGRAGRHGTAITLVSEHDIGEFDVLLAVFGDRMRQERLELYEPV